jgi:hypothetical protein
MKLTDVVMVTVLAAGCGGAAKRETTGNTAAPSVATTACPDGEAVKALAYKIWFPDGEPATEPTAEPGFDELVGESLPECGTFVRKGEALWFISHYLDSGMEHRMLAVTPDGQVRWRSDVMIDMHEANGYYENNYRGADLDGDGEDEILSDGHHGAMGHDDTQLVVSKLVGDTLQPIEGDMIWVSSDNSASAMDEADAEICDGALTLTQLEGRQQINLAYTGTNCSLKQTSFELQGGKVVERATTAAR